MKKLAFLFLLLPLFASAQNGYDIIAGHKIRLLRRDLALVVIYDTTELQLIKPRINQGIDDGFYKREPSYTLELPWNPPPPITVRIYIDDDDPVQTLIDALKKAGVIVERIEWNYEKKYSDYLITKNYW